MSMLGELRDLWTCWTSRQKILFVLTLWLLPLQGILCLMFYIGEGARELNNSISLWFRPYFSVRRKLNE
nr:MAG TPA: hypothetical protein [Bacteriophage sp.]